MILIRAAERARGWLRKEHPDVPCSRCAYCGVIGEAGCLCYDSTMSSHIYIPYSHGAGTGPCGFKWELKAAAEEACSRLAYMGAESLPPMVRDAYDILSEGLEHERKIRWHNEQEKE